MRNQQLKHRDSGIELLRIVGMLLIMLGHTHMRIHSWANPEAIASHPLTSFLEVSISCITTCGVGIFIAISGWYGIQFKKMGLAKYLFLVSFTLWTVYAIAIASDIAPFNLDGIKVSLGFYNGYWFVIGYLGLYLISPILNTFIEHASKRDYQIVLISYYLFQSYFSWLTAWYDYYSAYSIMLFAGIYMTAAYLRKYPIGWMEKHSLKLLASVSLIMALIAYFSLWKYGHAARQIRDDNPLVIFIAILFVLSFNKLKFHNKIVNWLASSCFAVYLIHFNPFVYPYFIKLIHNIYIQYDGVVYGVLLLSALLIVYLCCTLYDQIRILVWRFIQKGLF